MGEHQTAERHRSRSAEQALHRLAETVQALSLAATATEVQRITRNAARELTGADGATFVLRDGDHCFYVDEDAISPLWKGQRFPLEACISGWAMLHRRHVVIEDIYADERIPADAYRPTFVKSLLMVPIRSADPVGAIGFYWAERHLATEGEVGLARALADSTAVALENVQNLGELYAARRLAETDSLTGLPNRRAWDYALARTLVPSRAPVWVAALDIDGFKAHNDANGHPSGDELLRSAGASWRAILRRDDLLARTGGDEFALLLPDCDGERALTVTNRLRVSVPLGASASIGLARWDGEESAENLLSRADEALYEAKSSGRDRVVLAA